MRLTIVVDSISAKRQYGGHHHLETSPSSEQLKFWFVETKKDF